MFLPPGVGDYQLRAQLAALPADSPSAEFEVRPPQVEFEDVRLAELALAGMAEATGGEFYSTVPDPDGKGLDDVAEIPERIASGRRVTVSTTSRRLWDSWWVLLAFVALLATEWFLRKRATML